MTWRMEMEELQSPGVGLLWNVDEYLKEISAQEEEVNIFYGYLIFQARKHFSATGSPETQ